jgi:hypothetical protein
MLEKFVVWSINGPSSGFVGFVLLFWSWLIFLVDGRHCGPAGLRMGLNDLSIFVFVLRLREIIVNAQRVKLAQESLLKNSACPWRRPLIFQKHLELPFGCEDLPFLAFELTNS